MNSDRLTPGSLVGGMLLVAGNCIGAGMLALPIVMGLAGFLPSLSMLIAAWIFMTFTGCLLVEINGWFYGQVNFLSMAKEALGRTGYLVAWMFYPILFYSILVAYVAAGGSIFSAILETLFHLSVPGWVASCFFTAIFGWIIYLGTRPVDLMNRVLMVGLIVAYLGIIGFGLTQIHPKHLLHWDLSPLFSSLSILVLSFGFQNLIPTLTAYMKGDLKRVRFTILGGSSIVLIVYLLWSLVVLGNVPYEGILGSYQKGEDATAALRAISASSLSYFAQAFAFFAIITSFLAIGLTLTHFLADGFKVEPTRDKTRWLIPLVLAPPFLFGVFYPKIFIKALSFAGGICAMILFGILPILMTWVGRYVKKITSNYHVAGGKISLILALCFALFVITCELIRIVCSN